MCVKQPTIRNALVLSILTNRTLILPQMWCYCDNMWANLNSCRTPGAESMHLPFSCPMDHIFNPQGWFDDANISFREPFFLENPRVPHAVRESVAYVRVSSGKTL